MEEDTHQRHPQAIASSGLAHEFVDCLKKAGEYVDNTQVIEEALTLSPSVLHPGRRPQGCPVCPLLPVLVGRGLGLAQQG